MAGRNRGSGGGEAPTATLHMVTKEKNDNGEEKEIWTPLCAAWKTRNGFSMQLRTLPTPLLSGRPVKLVLKERD